MRYLLLICPALFFQSTLLGQHLGLSFNPTKWPNANLDSQRLYYDSGQLEIENKGVGDTLWRFEYFMDGTMAVKAEIRQRWRYDTVYTISPISYLDTTIVDSGFYDERVGRYAEWHPNGVVRFNSGFSEDKKIGNWKEWSASGSILKQYTFRGGLPTGKFREFYPEGQRKRTGSFDMGERVGTWKYWDENGVLVKKEKFRKLPKHP